MFSAQRTCDPKRPLPHVENRELSRATPLGRLDIRPRHADGRRKAAALPWGDAPRSTGPSTALGWVLSRRTGCGSVTAHHAPSAPWWQLLRCESTVAAANAATASTTTVDKVWCRDGISATAAITAAAFASVLKDTFLPSAARGFQGGAQEA